MRLNQLSWRYGALAVVVVSYLTGCRGKEPRESAVRVDSTAWVMQVQKSAKLYTADYQIHKIVTHDDVLKVNASIFAQEMNFDIPIGTRRVAIPIDVTLKAYIDFSGFSEKNIIRSGKRILVTLPDPCLSVTSSKIDHVRTKQFIDLTRFSYSDAELSHFARQGVASIIQDTPQMGILETARESAAHILFPMIQRLGYAEEDIIINFRKDFGVADIPQLLDAQTKKIIGR